MGSSFLMPNAETVMKVGDTYSINGERYLITSVNGDRVVADAVGPVRSHRNRKARRAFHAKCRANP